MQAYISQNNLLTPRQSGFRPRRSYLAALIDVVQSICTSLDYSQVILLVLLDHSTAFDPVHHPTLCHKLRTKFNFSHTVLKLISSYLSQRSQFTINKDVRCILLTLNRRVPQRSILGPLLYSNDLSNQVKHAHTQMYDNDVQLY